jgi:peptidoglycan/LPS O-acetylase OafA/YrhL
MQQTYRPDIDGLRALAVLVVVGFHAFPNWIQAGYIGVDVFFVISGFLISTIIFDNLNCQNFSFIKFYSRRIRRIFPALLLVLAASFVFGWISLLADEYKQLGKHIAGGAGFVSNFLFWRESSYFDNAADTKPLLHLWSLGIEEQFYIFWPLLLWLAWKCKINLLALILVLAIISFGLNIDIVRSDATAAFYSPLTRFWELLVGSVLAYLKFFKHRNAIFVNINDAQMRYLHNAQSIIGLTCIVLGMLFLKKDAVFPGWWALLPVGGAALIISAGSQAYLNRIVFSNRILVWFGVISFPLYLWHWPILSFARIIEGKALSNQMRISAVLLLFV